jgi:aminotransferase EvaB
MKKIIPFDGQRESFRDLLSIFKGIFRVVKSGNFILGNQLELFEKEFSEYLSDKKIYSVGTNSCTDSLYLSLKLFGIGKGDEVITQSNTAIPTVNSIVMTGATPVFVDVDDQYQIDINKIESKITKKTKAIICVHLFGNCCQVDTLQKICKNNSIKLIEDCAQSFGSTYKGKKLGTYGDTSCFSFYPTKVLGGYGDGGMVVCKTKTNYEKLKRMRFHGIDRRKGYYTSEDARVTMNSRLDEFHSSILRYKLKIVDKLILKRKSIAEYYLNNIKLDDLTLSNHMDGLVYYNFVVRHPNRDKILEYAKTKGVYFNINYPYPIHEMVGYSFLKKYKLENTEKFSNEVFNLPIYPTLKKSEMKKVVEVLNNFKYDN